MDQIFLLQVVLWLFLLSSGLSLVFGWLSKTASIYLSGTLGLIASVLGVSSGVLILLSGARESLSLAPVFRIPLSGLELIVDPLAAFFIMLICSAAIPVSIYSIGYLKAEYQDRSVGVLGALYHLFLLSMLLVVTAGNGLLFLVFWECMALLSFFLVIFDTTSVESRRAGFLYLLMTHLGTAFILILFLLLWQNSGSLDFSAFMASRSTLPIALKPWLFAFALIGFGTKAGIVPLHIWLPEAHPAAPSHISALMSGVMIKTALYALLRCLFDFLTPIPVEWGLIVMVIGLISALLGIVYASMEVNLKRLLAYSSIENMGIILLALGLGLVFQSLGHPLLSGIAFVSGFLHTLNHSWFKSLLFMAAGAVISTVHTRSLDQLGGLIHRMPQTAFCFLIGALAICAFPPLNGFVSEWLLYQSLLTPIHTPVGLLHVFLPIAAVLLGLIGALAAATFVKSFAATFLAMPRSHHAQHAQEVSWSMRFGMGLVGLACLLFGVFPNILLPLLDPVISQLIGQPKISHSLLAKGLLGFQTSLQANPGHSFLLSPVSVFLLLLSFIPITLGLLHWLGGKTKFRKEETWSCGVTPAPEFEYTGSGFSQPLGQVYSKLQVTIDCYERYLYIPFVDSCLRVSHKLKGIQAGNLQLYLLYIFCTLILCLMWLQQ